MKKSECGFTLVELMMVVAIIAVLAVLAVPAYQNEMSRARAASAVAELAVYRTAVAVCFNETQSLSNCNAGQNGVPGIGPTDFPLTANVLAVTSVSNGVITATTGATASSGGSALTYVATPVVASQVLRWQNSGTICHSVRGLRSGHGGCP